MTMAQKQNTFSLFDFSKKRTDKIQVFGEEALDEEGKVIPFKYFYEPWLNMMYGQESNL
jgi:hypothetical protein